MIEVYKTCEKDLQNKLKSVIARHICGTFEIKRTENGKPYIEGDPLFFSISHSKSTAIFAISDTPVGIDLEYIDPKRKIEHILSRFSHNEKSEICGNLNNFYENWVVKEAYIKLTGGTLAHDLKRLEYTGKKLYHNGKEANCKISVLNINDGGICAICGGVTVNTEDVRRFKRRFSERT